MSILCIMVPKKNKKNTVYEAAEEQDLEHLGWP